MGGPAALIGSPPTPATIWRSGGLPSRRPELNGRILRANGLDTLQRIAIFPHLQRTENVRMRRRAAVAVRAAGGTARGTGRERSGVAPSPRGRGAYAYIVHLPGVPVERRRATSAGVGHRPGPAGPRASRGP